MNAPLVSSVFWFSFPFPFSFLNALNFLSLLACSLSFHVASLKHCAAYLIWSTSQQCFEVDVHCDCLPGALCDCLILPFFIHSLLCSLLHSSQFLLLGSLWLFLPFHCLPICLSMGYIKSCIHQFFYFLLLFSPFFFGLGAQNGFKWMRSYVSVKTVIV